MKILLLSNNAIDIAENNIAKINNLSAIYGYYFKKYLTNFSDVEVIMKEIPYKKSEKEYTFPDSDYTIILINRGLSLINANNYNKLRKSTKKWICTICETNSIMHNEDILFFMMGKNKPCTLKLKWGSDFDLLVPNKLSKICFLIDHKYYGNKDSRMYKEDKTEIFAESLLKFKTTNDIIIKQISSSKLNEINSITDLGHFDRRSAMPFTDVYKDYCQAHVFIVTHAESLGLSVIECAAAGALIVLPQDFIKKEIIDNLHHVSIDFSKETINWSEIIKKIDINKSRQMAQIFSYKNAIHNIYNLFKSKEKHPELSRKKVVGKLSIPS